MVKRSCLVWIIVVVVLSSVAGARADEPLPRWDRFGMVYEMGLLHQVGNRTPIDYVIAPVRVGLRFPSHFELFSDSGLGCIVSPVGFLQAAWVAEGPETAHVGLGFAPHIEIVPASGRWSLYLSAGGGAGLIDSAPEVEGGQGQDFHFHWFVKAGVKIALERGGEVFFGPMFQHFSNGGMTDPNPGIDALGLSVGYGFDF